jgi:hypothetical protein
MQLLAFCLSCAVVSVAWCVMLVDAGMLLQPVQRWLREWYWARQLGAAHDGKPGPIYDLDSRWWWKPLWGCYRCNSVWWALLGYPLAFRADYSLWLHLVSLCATLFLACILNALYQWSQKF